MNPAPSLMDTYLSPAAFWVTLLTLAAIATGVHLAASWRRVSARLDRDLPALLDPDREDPT